jgi:hypothetical protein
MNAKAYLGDAVYAEWDGYYVVLTANGNEQTIYLDPAVWESLRRFVEAIHATEG